MTDFSFDRDRALLDVIDRRKALTWAEAARNALRIGVSIIDEKGNAAISVLPLAEPEKQKAADSLKSLASAWAADPESLLDSPEGSVEDGKDGFLWRAACLVAAGDPIAFLVLGPRVNPSESTNEKLSAIRRVQAGTLKALMPPLAKSLEWIIQTEQARAMVSDLHLETVETSSKDLLEANMALRRSEARLRNLVDDLDRKAKKAAAEAMEAQREAFLHERLASLGRLAAGVAHEINNPLGFIASNLATAQNYLGELAPVLHAAQLLAQQDDDANEAIKNIIEIAQKNDLTFLLSDLMDMLSEAGEGAGRVSKIVRDLKDFSRIDLSEIDEIDLSQSVEISARLIRGRLAGCGLLEVSTPCPVLVRVYAAAVHQAILNLLENALWALSNGGNTITISTGKDSERGWVEVKDDGPGIPEECLPRIFDPFYTTKAVGEGAGMGLTVVRDVARSHKGSVEVSSVQGKGACFKFILPLKKEQQ